MVKGHPSDPRPHKAKKVSVDRNPPASPIESLPSERPPIKSESESSQQLQDNFVEKREKLSVFDRSGDEKIASCLPSGGRSISHTEKVAMVMEVKSGVQTHRAITAGHYGGEWASGPRRQIAGGHSIAGPRQQSSHGRRE